MYKKIQLLEGKTGDDNRDDKTTDLLTGNVW